MKPYTYALLAAAAACGLAAAETAYTTPVGYVTSTTIAGGSPAAPGSTFVATPLVQADTFAGASTNAPGGTNTISGSGVPGSIDTSYYVEITTGPSEGWWSTVTSVAGNNITVNDTFPGGLVVGTTFAVRKHNTLSSFLGANAPGLDPGLSLEDADEVQLLNPATQVASSYFYALQADGAPVDGWYDGGGNSADSVAVEPGAAVLIKRKVAGNVSFVTVGTVKTTKTQVDIFPGDNWVSPMRATGVTLATMNLDTGNTSTGVQQGADLSVDEFQLIDLAQVTSAYFAADPIATGGFTGWFDGGGNPAGTVPVGETQGAVIKRKFASPAIWTVPAQVIAP